MADPWTAAWEEAEATAPPGVVVYHTIELQHPSFGSPIRCVAEVTADMNFTLEGAGGTVTFTAIPFFAERPEFAEGRTPSCDITVCNVGRELIPYIESAIGVKADLAVIYREFRSDDTSEPCYGPVRFVMRKVRVSGTSIIGTAQLDDLANRKFPNKICTVAEFPSLVTS